MIKQIIDSFNEILKIDFVMPKKLIKEMELLDKAILNKQIEFKENPLEFHLLINKKLGLATENFKNIIDRLAKAKVYFNYHEKKHIEDLLSTNEFDNLICYIKDLNNSIDLPDITDLLTPITREESYEALNNLLTEKDKDNVLSVLFGLYVFNLFEEGSMYNYFSGKNVEHSSLSYYEYLQLVHEERFPVRKSLDYIVVAGEEINDKNYSLHRDSIMKLIKSSYEELINHSHLAILIQPTFGNSKMWNLYSDIVLYAEKFKHINLKTGYFKPEKIMEMTKEKIQNLDVDEAHFEISNEGFTYLDCFILTKEEANKTSQEEYSILILLQKNERDEEVLPCPACRSYNVRGNSYPKINVKSWECQNLFCPDRSLSNRGKRYSFESIIKQQALLDERNLIEEEFLRKWKFDICKISSEDEILNLLSKNYTLIFDQINIYDNRDLNYPEKINSRLINKCKYKLEKNDLFNDFERSPFFKRYKYLKAKENISLQNMYKSKDVEIYNEDAFKVFASIPKESTDGAVTSPPYYNAKDYAQWENIYTYLYDMHNITAQIYDCLKPGSVFLYNIFDYFDNENTLVFSAMGKKRMILGAYIINLFRDLGFVVNGNIIWNKGEIEGKRNYNQGNNSPYYQAPFNSWEHIFIFSKDRALTREELAKFPTVLFEQPVKKIFKGKNIIGHDAPFPEKIPEMIVSTLKTGATVVEPFAGTFTTAVVAKRNGINSINAEYTLEYCLNGIKRIEEDLSLFTL